MGFVLCPLLASLYRRFQLGAVLVNLLALSNHETSISENNSNKGLVETAFSREMIFVR